MKKLLFVLLLTVTAALAQEPAPEATPTRLQRGIWRAELPGGKYVVRLSSINSISMHEYVVDNAARVVEVNIGTSGSDLVRFYVIEPNVPKAPGNVGQSLINMAEEKAKEALGRAGADDVWQKVVKNYPTTTHAHTIEFRLPDRGSLDALFESVEGAWLNGRAVVFKL